MDLTRILQIQPVLPNNVEINVSEVQTIVSNNMKFISSRVHSEILSKLSKMIKDQIKVIYSIYLFIFKLLLNTFFLTPC